MMPSDARVLVVDDVEANVRLLAGMLRSAGITDVHEMTDPRSVVRWCVESNPDLVLLDLRMPHMDGLEVVAALRAALPADVFLPVVMLTADVTAAAKEQALEAGVNDFLTKPFDCTEVLL